MKLRLRPLFRKMSEFFNVALLFVILGAGLFATGYLFPEQNAFLAGNARASDGDSMRIGDQRVRLLGIDAPELDQTCTDKNGENWPCGVRSKSFLSRILTTGEIQCQFDARDNFGRALVTCQIDSADIGALMVSNGWAISYNDYPAEEALARAGKLGLWAGDFIAPRAWRDGVRQPANENNWFAWLWGFFPS